MAVNKCIKYLLFIFNLLFWLSGCLILAVSIYLKVKAGEEGNKLSDVGGPGIDLMIAIGVIIMGLGFLGCCGAIKESRCMLLLFFISLLIIFILLLAAGILGAVAQHLVQDLAKDKMAELLPLSDQSPEVQKDQQKLEEKLKCCGLVNGPSDWKTNIPTSCNCTDTSQPCMASGSRQIYKTPCLTHINNLLEKNQKVLLGIAFAIAILMLFGMVFSMMLYCQIGKKEGPTPA
ncbi:tetraspanin-8-like [Genypterus blacodes]|uniref:tetraspanin-8-like n=1 Tax=Genypterus blacodes TaxID=154954 RepID=UPI003F76A79F